MELTISKAELLNGLAATQGIIEKRNTMPILANVFLDADGKVLRFIATDLEIGVRLEADAKVKTPGKITVPARKIFDIVKELPEKDLKIKSLENNRLEISVGKFRSEIAGLPADEFPNLPGYEDGKFFGMEAEILKEMLVRTEYAVSRDETRYNLNGIYFEKFDGDKKLRMVATDGHRLAITDRPIGGLAKAWTEKGLIVPRKAIAELRRLLEQNEKIELSFQKNHGIARAGGTVLLMQLIDGEFPKYEQVVPNELTRSAVVSRETLQAAVRRVLPFSDERTHMVRLSFNNGALKIEADSVGVGEAAEEIPLEYDGDELTIGFNARYLLDALGALKSGDVTIALVDEVNPATLTGVGEEGSLSIVMPMRI